MITSVPQKVLILCVNNIDNSRIVEDVHIPFVVTMDVDEIVESSKHSRTAY